jgi:L-threonylcarbamoyladenylate synthase
MEMLSTSDADLEKAASALAAGLLVAFPTETVYGLGADAFNQSALARIFEAKGRPRFDPLIIHIADPQTLWRIADESSMNKPMVERLSVLSERLWPGPLTLILPKRSEVPDLATSGLNTVAIRFPSHLVAQKLIRLSTGAVAAPSANLFGRLSPTRAGHVKAQLGDKVDYIIDGGKTQVGLESTVLDLSRDVPKILRQGGTEWEKIEALIGPVEISSDSPSETPLSPGQLKSHYAPRTSLVLCKRGEMDATPFASGEGRLYFSCPKTEGVLIDRTKVLSEAGNLTEAAANLFDCLHELDGMGLDFIRAEEAPGCGLGEAINDRLRRAAH